MKRTALIPVKLVPLICTEEPTGPVAGVNVVIVGTWVTMKSVALVPVPLALAIVMRPVVAPVGTVVVICVLELTVNAAFTPLNFTVTVPLKSAPVIVTLEPTGPLVGVNDVIDGADGVTVKSVAEVALPFGVVTTILPVDALVGTVAVMRPELLTVKVAVAPLNVTAVAPVKLVPLICTLVPLGPLLGVNDVMVGPEGVTVKLLELVPVPAEVTTEMAPVPAPVGTVAVICVGPLTVYVVALVPAKRTAVAPVKFVPVMTTEVPGAPLLGVKPEIVGGPEGVTSKLAALVPVPAELTTEIGPSVAADGTVAVICVFELTVYVVAAVPLKRTEVAPLKLVPVMTTDWPMGPLVGLNDETVGVTAGVTSKFVELVPVPPPGTVTAIGPSVAPVGTAAVIWVAELTVKVASVPLNSTRFAPVKFVPVMTTFVPTGPLVGENDVTVGVAPAKAGAASTETSCSKTNNTVAREPRRSPTPVALIIEVPFLVLPAACPVRPVLEGYGRNGNALWSQTHGTAEKFRPGRS